MNSILIGICAILMVGCCHDQALQKPSKVAESLLVPCDTLPKFSEFSKTSTVENQIEYTKRVMDLHTECAVGKDSLIKSVRIIQNTK